MLILLSNPIPIPIPNPNPNPIPIPNPNPNPIPIPIRKNKNIFPLSFSPLFAMLRKSGVFCAVAEREVKKHFFIFFEKEL